MASSSCKTRRRRCITRVFGAQKKYRRARSLRGISPGRWLICVGVLCVLMLVCAQFRPYAELGAALFMSDNALPYTPNESHNQNGETTTSPDALAGTMQKEGNLPGKSSIDTKNLQREDLNLEDKHAIYSCITSDDSKTITLDAADEAVQKEVLTVYQNLDDVALKRSGYQDLMGHVWMCVVQHPRWVDVVRIDTQTNDAKCRLQKLRLVKDAWEEEARAAGIGEAT